MIEIQSQFKQSVAFDESDNSQRKWFIKNRLKREKALLDEQVDQADNAYLNMATTVILANEIQLREFERSLDLYETRLNTQDAKLNEYERAIVEALQENAKRIVGLEVKLAEVESEIEDMLESAHTLDDGRRVFKSKDGSVVEDEHGTNISIDEIDFDTIGGKPLELYKERVQSQIKISTELEDARDTQTELTESLEEVDAAKEAVAQKRESLKSYRDKIENGELTVDDIDDAKIEFEDFEVSTLPTLPTTAAKYLSRQEQNSFDNVPKIKHQFQALEKPQDVVPQFRPIAAPEF